jgi:hypothetical protein
VLPAGRWVSTPRPTTGGKRCGTATAQRSCGPESHASRGWPTPPAHWSSNGSSPSRLATPALAQPGSPPSWPVPNGVGSACRRTGSGGCYAATAYPLAPNATDCWPATPHRRRLSVPRRNQCGTWTWTGPVSWSNSTALHRPAAGHQGHRLAVHRHRCGLGLHLGVPAHELLVTPRNPSAAYFEVPSANRTEPGRMAGLRMFRRHASTGSARCDRAERGSPREGGPAAAAPAPEPAGLGRRGRERRRSSG